MGAASGGRLTLWLLGLAVLIASGATSIVVTHDGSPPRQSGSSAQMLGSSDQRPDRGQPATAQAQPQSAPASGSAQAQARAREAAAEAAAAHRAGRYNVGAAHSPELLQSLSGSLTSAGAPAGNQPRGVDVAADQHPGGAGIDWAQVAAAGYSFAAIKATEGDYYANPYYAADVAGARAAGLQVTGYQVAIPNVSGGAAQAGYAVSHLGRTADGAIPALEVDVEYDPYTAIDHTNQCYGLSAPQLVAWIGAFTQQARQLTGQTPVIYTTAGWWRACTGDSTAFSADSLWVAGHGTSAPALPATWAGYSYWEFTSAATVPGIAARGSVDVSYGSRHTTPDAPAVAGMGGVAAGVRPVASISSQPTAAPPVAVPAGASASASASAPGGPVAEVAPRPAATAPSPVAPVGGPSPSAIG